MLLSCNILNCQKVFIFPLSFKADSDIFESKEEMLDSYTIILYNNLLKFVKPNQINFELKQKQNIQLLIKSIEQQKINKLYSPHCTFIFSSGNIFFNTIILDYLVQINFNPVIKIFIEFLFNKKGHSFRLLNLVVPHFFVGK